MNKAHLVLASYKRSWITVATEICPTCIQERTASKCVVSYFISHQAILLSKRRGTLVKIRLGLRSRCASNYREQVGRVAWKREHARGLVSSPRVLHRSNSRLVGEQGLFLTELSLSALVKYIFVRRVTKEGRVTMKKSRRVTVSFRVTQFNFKQWNIFFSCFTVKLFT